MPRYTEAYKISVLERAKVAGVSIASKENKLPMKTILRWNDIYHIYHKMELRTFTDEEKIKILKYANKYGMTSAMRKYNIDTATQRMWNRKFNIYKKTGRRAKATYKKKYKHHETEYKMEVLLFTKQYGISKLICN